MAAPTTDRQERLFTGYTGRVAIVLGLGWIGLQLGRAALPPLLPSIIEDLAISPARAGFALTLLWGLYALVQYPGGRLSDQWSRTTVLATSLTVMALGFGLLTLVFTYPALLVAVMFAGVGAGLYFTPTRAFLSDLFVKRRGQAFGIHMAVGMGASAGAAGLAVAAITYATWREAFAVPVAVVLGSLVLLHWVSREPYVVGAVDFEIRETAARILRDATVRRPLITQILRDFTVQAFIGFLPLFLLVEKGFSPALAGAAFGTFYLIGIPTSVVGGDLGDRFSRLSVLLGTLGLSAIGLAGVVLGASPPVVVVAVVVTAAGFWSFSPVMQAYIMDVIPKESMGGDFGALKTVYTGIGSLGPTYVGVVAEQASYTLAFAGLVVLLGTGLLTMAQESRL